MKNTDYKNKHIQRKIWIFIPIICAAFLLLFLFWKKQSPAAESSKNQKQVIMLYMVGSDLESERGLASADIREIQESGFDEEHLQIVICTGGAAFWWNDAISADECAVFEAHANGDLSKVNTLDMDNMTDPATITAFMDYVYEQYQADSYSMILWDHGGGAVIGYGGDENHSYDMLTLYELNEAFANTGMNGEGKKLEWIGFDACLMGMIEVANTCAPYADYLVASEGMTSEAGWDYSFLKKISEGTDFSGEAAGEEIVKAYGESYASSEYYEPEFTIACMELSQTERVIDRLEAFIHIAEPDLKDGSYSTLAKERDKAKAFGRTDTSVNYDIVDLYNLAEQFEERYPKEAAALREAVSQMVVCQETNVADAHGVAIYFPYHNKEDASKWLEEYSQIGFSDTYVEFLKEFTETLTGERMTNWNMAETVPVKEGENTYSISLTPEQAEHYAHATFSTWESVEEWQDGCYIMWMDSSDTVLDEGCTLQATADERRFLLCDDAGHRVSCSATELERNEAYATYGIGLYLSYAAKDGDQDTKDQSGWATVYIRVDEEHPDGVITGIYEGTSMDMIPGRISCELEQGTKINPFAYIRQITFDDNGKVLPFEEWKMQSSVFEGFNLEGDLSVTMENIEEDAKLLHVFFISDTQGNVYTTNCIE